MQSFTRIRDKLLKIWDPNFVGNFLQPGVFYIFLAHFATDSCELRIITKFDIINKAVELCFFSFLFKLFVDLFIDTIKGNNRKSATVKSVHRGSPTWVPIISCFRCFAPPKHFFIYLFICLCFEERVSYTSCIHIS